MTERASPPPDGGGPGAAGSGDRGPRPVGDGDEGHRAPRVKICGLQRQGDVEAAAEAGADFVGLVLAGSPRRVDEETAGRLARAAVEAGMRPVGVFVDRSAPAVAAVARDAGLRVAQLHGNEPPEACRALRDQGLEVWKAVRPRARAELAGLAERYGEAADALLVEGHSPGAAGGTGTGFPRAWLRAPDGSRVVRRLVLAGGLDPGNVAAAVREARPEVVDVSSGVESALGRKDPGRIRAFVEAARSAGTRPGRGGAP